MTVSARPVPKVDPIELEIIQEAMISIVREMRVNLVATAYSSIIYEAYDFSCVLIDGTGQIVALAEDNPSHIFPVPWSVRQMFDTFGDDIGPGDVFLHNDPYTGGTHLNDIAMMFPVFAEGRLVLFPCVRAHWGDVGGTTPGSISGKSTEIFHDGVRLPIVKIASGGELNRGLFDVMMANMRVPRERRGDFMSTWGTCQVAERRIAELFERYGVATVEGAIAELIDRAERRTRQRIEALADREYVYEHYLDPVGTDAEPVIAKARIRIEGSDLAVDFTGSSGQTRAAMNAGPAVAATGAFIVLKAFLDPAQPINHGNFRPISITAPEGSFFNARYPASCAGSSEVRHAAISAVLGAMAPAMPERMAGDIKGTSNHIYIGGKDPERPEPFIFYEYPAGGTGATAEGDGGDALRNFAEGDFASIQSVESIEHESPLLVERCEIRRDSGGAGRHRGGCGLRRDVRVLVDEALLSVSSNKNILPPFGVAAGWPGAPNNFSVIRNGAELAPSDTPGQVQGFPLQRSDIVVMRSSGGGGFGDPLEREPSRVLADIAEGRLSAEAARRVYGVVADTGKIDTEATTALRAGMKAARRRLAADPLPGSPPAGRSWCELASGTIARLGLREGGAHEILDAGGPGLRIWIRGGEGIDEDTLRLPERLCRALNLRRGDGIALRPITEPPGAGTP
ncbi:MAG: hydantoinase B/oxoprolinase family protein [Rhodospirillaceae bacterium]|nr:hydantoinase B/oxoprolinase family protein [Rhodospirillaceae bacterium]